MAYFLAVLGIVLGFLMLVINTGVIVYQKIRLQTAVDLAAYAGASVQASYLGNQQSGKESIASINQEILKRYQQLTEDLDMGTGVAPWPSIVPLPIPGEAGRATCMAMCAAANTANAGYAVSVYKKAAADLALLRLKAARIISELPKASQRAAEATLRLNIPELSLGDGAFASITSETTNDWKTVVQEAKASGADALLAKKKNAVLSFSSEKGLYLANVVAPVSHSYVYYGLPGAGPFCMNADIQPNTGLPYMWYCLVNGSGITGMQNGYNSAFLSYTMAVAKQSNPNPISKILDGGKAKGIRLNFIQNDHKPGPFFLAAAEWYPENGSFMNMENSFGATGSLFPKKTKLAALAAAEPFGGHFASIGRQHIFYGVRLQSIRKLLLDPRMQAVKDDFPGLGDYMESLAPLDSQGRPVEKSDEVVRRFLH